MAAKLITLEAWAVATYGEASPHINTLRRWARDSLIIPTRRSTAEPTTSARAPIIATTAARHLLWHRQPGRARAPAA